MILISFEFEFPSESNEMWSEKGDKLFSLTLDVFFFAALLPFLTFLLQSFSTSRGT